MKSPLRYPGGKTKAINILFEILNKYDKLLSPFCGGCSFEFKLIESLPNLKSVILNDLFKPLILFWQQVKCNNGNHQLVKDLKQLVGKVDKLTFDGYREDITYFLNSNNSKFSSDSSDLYIAEIYFIINRCSFSGATLSGGFSSSAAEKRFTLISKLNNKLNNVMFECQDFSNILSNQQYDENTFIFCDPPYYLGSNSKLYDVRGDLHENFNHQLFHDLITKQTTCNWMITFIYVNYIKTIK